LIWARGGILNCFYLNNRNTKRFGLPIGSIDTPGLNGFFLRPMRSRNTAQKVNFLFDACQGNDVAEEAKPLVFSEPVGKWRTNPVAEPKPAGANPVPATKTRRAAVPEASPGRRWQMRGVGSEVEAGDGAESSGGGAGAGAGGEDEAGDEA
jgi:hypothetical protein